MGALSRFLPRRFSLVGYPIVVTRQQYSTAGLNTVAFQSRSFTPRYMDGLFPDSQNSLHIKKTMKPFLKFGLILLSVVIIGGSNSSAVSSASNSFSKNQIASYMQIVTTNLEKSQNQRAELGTFTQANLSCYSVLLGEGDLSGNHGIYTWFTCSGIHNAVLPSASKGTFSCTGFSSAVWIEPVGKTVNYVTATNTTQYLALRSAAPQVVQNKLSLAYNLLHPHSYRQVVGHAVQTSSNLNQAVCS